MNILNHPDNELWQDIAGKCSWATYFHTPQWAELIEKTYPDYRVSATGFIFDSGARVILPSVSRCKKGFFRNKIELKSMQPGVYGGIISDRDLSEDETGKVALCLLKKKKSSGRIVESPYRQFNMSAEFKVKDLFTHIVDLSSDYDIIKKKFSRGQKSNIKQALKKKVTVRQAETESDIDTYYSIYRQTIERWTTNVGAVCPQSLFLNIFQQKDPGASFWLAEADNRIAAGIIVLSWNKNIIYWHGCALKEYFKYYPNNLLHATVMEWGCKNSYTHYDMGASMGMDGVTKFKKSFGAVPWKYRSYRWK